MSEQKQYTLLWPAIRQLRHNNGDGGFVMAYDQKETERLVGGLQAEIERLRAQLAAKQSVEPIGELGEDRGEFYFIQYANATTLQKGAKLYTHAQPAAAKWDSWLIRRCYEFVAGCYQRKEVLALLSDHEALRQLEQDLVDVGRAGKPAEQPTAAIDERPEFERCITNPQYSTQLDGDGVFYVDEPVQDMWAGWQLRAKLNAQPAPETQGD